MFLNTCGQFDASFFVGQGLLRGEEQVIFVLHGAEIEMVKDGIETVPFEPPGVIHQFAVTAQFLDKDLITQSFGSQTICVRFRKLQRKMCGIKLHPDPLLAKCRF